MSGTTSMEGLKPMLCAKCEQPVSSRLAFDDKGRLILVGQCRHCGCLTEEFASNQLSETLYPSKETRNHGYSHQQDLEDQQDQ
jgi:hypothetical protein